MAKLVLICLISFSLDIFQFNSDFETIYQLLLYLKEIFFVFYLWSKLIISEMPKTDSKTSFKKNYKGVVSSLS